MYTKDKSNRITLRLNDDAFLFVKSQADLLGISPSEFLRMVVNLTMATTNQTVDRLNKRYQEGSGRENDKTDINNLV